MVKWALTLGVDAEDAAKLKRQKFNGAGLRYLTEENMVKLYSISGVAASKIMEGLAKLFPTTASAASSAPGPTSHLHSHLISR